MKTLKKQNIYDKKDECYFIIPSNKHNFKSRNDCIDLLISNIYLIKNINQVVDIEKFLKKIMDWKISKNLGINVCQKEIKWLEIIIDPIPDDNECKNILLDSLDKCKKELENKELLSKS
jgi:hypothetical protein